MSRRVSRETENKAPRNKPSSFYVYLIILFGAAFLMLLLAYFVQQRNNETVLDNLRTTTASREELLEKIEELEEEKQSLLNEMGDLQRQLEQLQSDLNFANTSLDNLGSEYFKYVDYTSILQALYTGEVKLESGDYEGAARELTGIEYGDFVSTIDLFDTETKQYNPYYPDKGMLLRPRFDELVSVLTEQGVLEEEWVGQQQP
ncbi:MAG: hypothetical protein K2M42_00390 [Oscillospiraceae bacterium]|nr:hypothetical protein [Oscillospiraceae bacterium]